MLGFGDCNESMVEAAQRPHPIGAVPPPDRGAPILVTGTPRSGSTWVGNVLALDRGAGYIHEPFNKHCPAGRCRAGFRDAFTYITPETEGPYVAALRDTIDWKYSLAAELKSLRTTRQAARMTRDFVYFEVMRQRGARAILKDPLALLSADWLARRFGCQVVVVIRHPAAFVASLRATRWHRVRFEVFGNQPLLMRDRLAPFAEAIAAATRTMPDAIDAGALLWNILHHHIARLRQEHPDWIFARHEDLSRDPAPEFRAIFDRLGLDFSDEVYRSLEGYTAGGGALSKFSLFGTRRRTMRNSRDNIFAFRDLLTPEEIARVRAATAPLSERFYTDADW